MGRAAGASGLEGRKEKKERGRAIALGLGLGHFFESLFGPTNGGGKWLSWVGIRPRLKEMGLGGVMGGMGSGCLQLCFRTLFDVLVLIFFTNVRSMQGQFLKKWT